MVSNLLKKNLKKVIGILLILVAVISGIAVYATNKDKVNETAADSVIDEEENNIIEENNNEEEKVVEETPKEEEINKAEEVIKKEPEQKKEIVKVDESKAKNNSDSKTIDKKSPEEKTKNENKKVSAESTTYKSQGLGVSFDIPAIWSGKYVIKDDGKDLAVFMKHERNNEGIGLLFIITSDLEMGNFMDTIYGINKEQTINGKKYLVGGPTDYRMDTNDPLDGRYREMITQCKSVLVTLR